METYEIKNRQITLVKETDCAVLTDKQLIRNKKGVTVGAWVEFKIGRDGSSTIRTERVPLTFAFVISQRQKQFKDIVLAGLPEHPFDSLKKWLDARSQKAEL